MAKVNLTEDELKVLSEQINNQAEISEELLLKLSPGFFAKLAAAGRFDFKALDKFKIPTIEYAGKRNESVILAQATITGDAAPLQIVRSFANSKNGDWKNLIVQGDNLQFLKTCYLNQDSLIKNVIKGQVKLIYIDPPFATEQEFSTNDDVKSYSDKILEAEFLEGLRERLIYLREILTVDGSIYVHLDWKKLHYVKVILDEIFREGGFQHEIIWHLGSIAGNAKGFPRSHETILIYSKAQNFILNEQKKPFSEKLLKSLKRDEKGWYYTRGSRSGRRKLAEWEIKSGVGLKTYVDPDTGGTKVNDIWDDIGGYNMSSDEKTGYPTQKPERLLMRVLQAGSNPGDIVLDAFAGSGTTGAVAEKLGRRWVVCDFGKHAVYTMQKRILNIENSRKLGGDMGNNDKYGQPPKPFCVVSAGAYDFSKIMNLRKNKDAYVSFVLGLFGISKEDVDFSKKYKLSNIYAEKENNPVEVYPVWEDEYLKDIRIDEDYLKDIMKASGDKLKGVYYIVVPETCTVISDIILKNRNNEKVDFKLLKFPYKVLEDVSRHFQIEEQASSSTDINKLISSAGFYFNEEVKIELEKTRGGFKITKFKTEILDKNKERFKGLDGLSMLLVDVDYGGDIFDMDVAIYSSEIDREGFVKVEGLSKDSHLIAIDKHGNESKITKIL